MCREIVSRGIFETECRTAKDWGFLVTARKLCGLQLPMELTVEPTVSVLIRRSGFVKIMTK